MSGGTIYRVPPGVEFLRWRDGGSDGAGEWVVLHSGTGETLRLSEAAMALLDDLLGASRLDRADLIEALGRRLDTPLPTEALGAAVDELLGALLVHECIETVPCE